MPKRKKATPVKPDERFPGVYLTEVPRMLGFGKGPATGIRPAGPHKSNIPTRQEVKTALRSGEEE